MPRGERAGDGSGGCGSEARRMEGAGRGVRRVERGGCGEGWGCPEGGIGVGAGRDGGWELGGCGERWGARGPARCSGALCCPAPRTAAGAGRGGTARHCREFVGSQQRGWKRRGPAWGPHPNPPPRGAAEPGERGCPPWWSLGSAASTHPCPSQPCRWWVVG